MSKVAIEKILWIRKGEAVAASGQIPEDAEFFKDHFPGFPVLPGVLAIEMLKQTAEQYFRSLNQPQKYRLKQISKVKFSAYLRPKDSWESHLEVVADEAGKVEWKAKLLHAGELACSANLLFEEVVIPESLAL